MSSPYRYSNTFSLDSPELKQRNGNGTSTPTLSKSKRGQYDNSYYASPTRDLRVKQPEILDIDKIDHEYIKNDGELKKLSRNPGAFNKDVVEEDEAYYDTEDDDDDLFAEEERLVHDPMEERRLRTFISQASSLSNQNVPRTPNRRLSFNSHIDNNSNDIDIDDKPISWKVYLMNILFGLLRACVFQLFMIYWIIKEPIIRTVTFFTMIVSFILIDPLLFIWSKLPRKTHYWIPTVKRRQQIASICTFILFMTLVLKYIPAELPKIHLFEKTTKVDNQLWTQIKHLENLVNQQENKLKQIDDLVTKHMLIQTNDKNGEIELSPNFLNYIKDNFIEAAIRKYHQDVLNTADFALKSRGGEILYSMTSPTFYPLSAWVQGLKKVAGLTITEENSPDMAITPTTYPGECWQMYGNNGQLAITLSQSIFIQGITVEYPSNEIMVNNMENAPKDMIVYGLDHSQERILLTQITYDIHKDSSIQTFNITSHSDQPFRAVIIHIESNWGSLDHTDIYRIRVHGIPVDN